MMNTEKFFLHLIQTIYEKLVKIVETEKDPQIRELFNEYCQAYRLLHSQMSAIAGEYGNVVNNLHEIRRNLDIIQGVRRPNIGVLNNVRRTAGDAMRTLQDAQDKIENSKSKISRHQAEVNSGLASVKKERRRDILLQVCESVGRAFPLGLLGAAAAGELITYKALAGAIASAANPVYALCFASLYATTSQLIKYFTRKNKRKGLVKNLEEISRRLQALFDQADTFTTSHSPVFQDLEQYLITIHTTIANLNGVGEINVESATKSMLEETITIQNHFVTLRNQAQENANALREPLRRLDSGYLVHR